MATLLLKVDGDHWPAGVVADITSMSTDSRAEATDRRDILVPAGAMTPTLVTGLPVGDYLVQARLPSGQILTKRVCLNDDEATATIIFQPDRSDQTSPIWRTSFSVAPNTTPPRILRNLKQLDREAEDPSQPAAEDDLTRIRGIGPMLQAALKDRGVRRIAQVASFSDREVNWLRNSVKTSRSTIARYDIAREARELLSAGKTPVVPEDDARAESVHADLVDVSAMDVATSVWFARDEANAPPFWAAVDILLRRREPRGTQVMNLAKAIATVADDGPVMTLGADGADWQVTGSIAALKLPASFGDMAAGKDLNVVRAYAVVHDGLVSWLVALPVPWRVVGVGNLAEIILTADRSNPLKSTLATLPRDGRVASLLGYLRLGDIEAAATLLNTAHDLLFKKMENPFAAAAGGLVLIQALRKSAAEAPESLRTTLYGPWPEWLDNLCDWYPWMPDGFVLRAWRSILTDPSKMNQPRGDLIKAALSGLPVYSGTFRLMMEGLRSIESQLHAQDDYDIEIAEALKLLDRPALRVDIRQIFTTIRLTDRPCQEEIED